MQKKQSSFLLNLIEFVWDVGNMVIIFNLKVLNHHLSHITKTFSTKQINNWLLDIKKELQIKNWDKLAWFKKKSSMNGLITTSMMWYCCLLFQQYNLKTKNHLPIQWQEYLELYWFVYFPSYGPFYKIIYLFINEVIFSL